MKTIFLFTALAVILCIGQGCDNNDDLPSPNGNEKVENTFKLMYPDATSAEWEKKGPYWTVDFREDGKEKEAWFDEDGNWYQTETDLAFIELPEAVKTSFQSGDYGDWRVEDVDMFEYKDADTFYVLEVEKGNQDYDLYYSSDGTMIKAVADHS